MLAERCLDVMSKLLHFNMGALKTPFLPNNKVEGFDERIEKAIPSYLRYICRFWAAHLRDARFSDALLDKLLTFVYCDLLFWFEVLSLTKEFYHVPGPALHDAIAWIPVRIHPRSSKTSSHHVSDRTRRCRRRVEAGFQTGQYFRTRHLPGHPAYLRLSAPSFQGWTDDSSPLCIEGVALGASRDKRNETSDLSAQSIPRAP